MKQKTHDLVNLLLTLSGFLFSGYLSSVKLFTSNCWASEPCPLFLGYPACYFGFALFSVLFVASLLAFCHKISIRTSQYGLRVVAFCGTLFAGYYVVQEIIRYRATGLLAGALVLPTCAYGLVFFVLILAVSFRKPVG
jgi:uncharacterized membrane protein